MPARKVILMYHSVSGPAQPAVLGSYPIALRRFQHQITQARSGGWRFGRISELHQPVESDTLYVTGDDGTVDWVRNALPWCEREGVPTHTAIITGPWRSEPIYPVAHRIQIMLTTPQRKLPQPALSDEQRSYIDRVYAYETNAQRRYLKGACNVVLDDPQCRALLGPPTEEESVLLKARFATPDEYQGFKLAEFGAHTVTHRAFDGDAHGYVRYEVAPSVAMLRDAGLEPTACFTLPMRPRHPTTVDELVPALQENGFDCVLDGAGEWDQANFVTPRIDAKRVEEFLKLAPYGGDDPDESVGLEGHEISRQ